MNTTPAGALDAPADSTRSPTNSAAFWGALVLTGFNALSAIAGAIGILAGNGLGMPVAMLAGSPFSTFVVPGIVLGAVIGGTQVLAFVLLCTRRESALVWTAVAGFGMLVWIFVETGIIAGLSWLQVLYFVTGAGELALVLGLLGVVSWMPRVVFSHAAVGE